MSNSQVIFRPGLSNTRKQAIEKLFQRRWTWRWNVLAIARHTVSVIFMGLMLSVHYGVATASVEAKLISFGSVFLMAMYGWLMKLTVRLVVKLTEIINVDVLIVNDPQVLTFFKTIQHSIDIHEQGVNHFGKSFELFRLTVIIQNNLNATRIGYGQRWLREAKYEELVTEIYRSITAARALYVPPPRAPRSRISSG